MAKDYLEHETVVLMRDYHEQGLRMGDVGAIVHVYEAQSAYDVEFTRADGHPVAILTLSPEEIRHMGTEDVLHVRRFTSNQEPHV